MNLNSIYTLGVLILYFVMVGGVLSGCNSTQSEPTAQARLDAVEPQIEQAIEDPALQKQLLAIHQQMDELSKSATRRAGLSQQQLMKLHQSPTATREEFESVFKAQRKAREASIDEMLSLRMKAAKLTTEDQWEALLP